MAAPKKPPLDEKQLKDLEKLAGLGITHHNIAAFFGMHYNTFLQLVKKDDTIRQTLLNGKSKAAIKLYTSAYEMATSGTCPTMTIFYLKTRHGWKEQKEDTQKFEPYVIRRQNGEEIEMGMKVKGEDNSTLVNDEIIE